VISKPSRHCAVELQALPSRIGQVRRIVSAQLRYWRLDPLIDAAVLGVTELLSNVHRHAEPDKQCRVDMVLHRDRLTVSVSDHDPRVPPVHSEDAAATAGRGLPLVASFSDSWGVRAHGSGGGKAVWFTLVAPAPAVPPAAAAHPPSAPPLLSRHQRSPAPAAARGLKAARAAAGRLGRAAGAPSAVAG
jgi:anti-sigma regulatory factor (Ser/Thr protein kinase)